MRFTAAGMPQAWRTADCRGRAHSRGTPPTPYRRPARLRTVRRAGAPDDAVVADAVRATGYPGEFEVFGRSPRRAGMVGTEPGGDTVEIGHGPDGDPGLRRGHRDIGAAKAEVVDQQ